MERTRLYSDEWMRIAHILIASATKDDLVLARVRRSCPALVPYNVAEHSVNNMLTLGERRV